jgi:hypothetical protein
MIIQYQAGSNRIEQDKIQQDKKNSLKSVDKRASRMRQEQPGIKQD